MRQHGLRSLGATRFVASFVDRGIFDPYPNLRVLECGFGWLGFWAWRLDEQARHVGGDAALKQTPSEYLTSDRFCSMSARKARTCSELCSRRT